MELEPMDDSRYGDAAVQAQADADAAHARRSRWHWLWKLPLLAVAFSIAQVLLLRVTPPLFTPFMALRQVEALASGDTGFRVAYDWEPAARLSPQLLLALVAAEDQRFAVHDGFDFDAIERAQAHNQRAIARAERRGTAAARLRGASTISQQTAKNLFLWQGSGATRWLRKGLEVWYTLLLEHLWPKSRILEMYANVAEFGDGVYGAQAAARSYWRKDAAALTAAEAARLAAVLPSPRRYSAARPGPYVQRRANAIQRQMLRIGGSAYLDALD